MKKMAFYEVGKGRFASEAQALFEQAQIEARERNADVAVVLKIIVSPPDHKSPNYGNLAYSTDMKVPPRKSMQYITELKDGVIVSDGESVADILQL